MFKIKSMEFSYLCLRQTVEHIETYHINGIYDTPLRIPVTPDHLPQIEPILHNHRGYFRSMIYIIPYGVSREIVDKIASLPNAKAF